MRKYLLLSVATILLTLSGNAQSVLGKWYSIDPDTGMNESVIEVYEKEDKVYGKIVQILKEEDKDKTCIECTGKDKDQPIQGLNVLGKIKTNPFKGSSS